ncbi:uncharacterized protein PHALS_09450 [Plasmopara halstedii]|uniref:Reverse transcriptase n=1 Tax=Plasmopara halstedii TaxID=4781 RepID=A0A0P1A495_PLAHL|nr:uncharacterized protein PHALS_09450 [Plasmopara halstedii]CEG35324.1 hypothetical protein PHALS_09450 [Plasmopara halstedii]|eukprot:XP_024571693.1 hypothetical protein PHALS_09450 [Plasmopara halstedii]
MTGEEDGDVTLEAFPAMDALFELNEMSYEASGGALKAGHSAEVVIMRPNEEINSSSFLDEAALDDTKREFQDVVPKDPPSVLPPDRGVRHEIDLVPETNTA